MLSSDELEIELKTRAQEIEDYLQHFFASMPSESTNAMGRLQESMRYSALGPGKRFRPVLSLLTAESLGLPVMKVLPWAAAVEMIHTYSLIHDDLPCMDDDQERRGRPTNHVVYGESLALLAGDALLTEAFGLIGASYSGQGAVCGRVVSLLAEATGAAGMVGGQVLDMDAEEKGGVSIEELRRIHELKTGRLIRVAVEGSAQICGASEELTRSFADYGAKLGFAFQVADDLLDAADEGQDGRSFITHLGVEGTKSLLSNVSDEARAALRRIPSAHPALMALIDWNQRRTK